jgi:hypothetical protein
MPRPCQRRRESAAAQRKSKPNPKPAHPPPIRHKAKQKAIHNARRGRGSSRSNGRGGGRGGQPSRNQRSGQGDERNQDYISLSGANNFNVLHGAGSRHDPIALDGDDSLEDGELSDSGSDEDDSDDSDMHNGGALTINIDVGRGRPPRAVVMFTMAEAIARYKGMLQAGFPLEKVARQRYGAQGLEPVPGMRGVAPVPDVGPVQQAPSVGLSQYTRVAFKKDAIVGSAPTAAHTPSSASSYVSPASTSMSRQPSASTATSRASTARPSAQNAARDYVFNWGAHQGVPFLDVPEQYLRTIGGNASLLEKHPGVKEAFDYYRPGLRRTAPTARQLASQEGAPVPAASRGRVQGTRGKAKVSWTTYTFPTGAHAKKKLNEVPENYLRTIEGMAHVVNKWVGLREAILDYNAKTGRQSKIAS